MNPASFLRSEFLDRKQRNGRYSTRAFARDLGMSQALLSLVLNEKRPLSTKQATRIAALLGLPGSEAQALLEATLPMRSKPRASFRDFEIERFKAISQWHHVAVLDLVTTKSFRNDPYWIARRLGISAIEARDALERLVTLGFLERSGRGVRKTDAKIYFATANSEAAVRSFHRAMLAKAQAKLDDTSDRDFARRDISGVTMAIRADRLAEAKKRIQRFQKELADFLTDGDCDEVYQLNMQLFPLTKEGV